MDIPTKVAETASSCNVSPVRIVVADRKRKSLLSKLYKYHQQIISTKRSIYIT